MNFIKNMKLHNWSSFAILLLAMLYTQGVRSQVLGDFLQKKEVDTLVFSGVVLDENKEPAGYAVVMILADDVVIAGANTDENGFYKITFSPDDFEGSDVSLKVYYLASEKTIEGIPLSAMKGGKCIIDMTLKPASSHLRLISRISINYPDMSVRKMWSGTHISFSRGREISRY